jgi:hypothetical protein
MPFSDPCLLWARALWRSAILCLAVMLLAGTASLVEQQSTSKPNGPQFSADFEQTMLAAIDQPGEVW